MAASRTGIWLLGARGNIGATVSLGISLLARQQIEPIALLTSRPEFRKLGLTAWTDFVVGGHEIREGSLAESAGNLLRQMGGIDPSMVETCREELDQIDGRILPGTLAGCNDTIRELGGDSNREFSAESPRETLNRLQGDLQAFQKEFGLERVIVVNVASTEAPFDCEKLPAHWEEFDQWLDSGTQELPASCLYAIAALDLGMPYINFTPSLGSALPAIGELAELRGTCHVGRDGKTGETLLKSVLAPMFAARNLSVMSWVGHNIFGNMDARVLDDPANKSSKVKSKDQLLGEILGYQPQTLVSIENIQSMGDWKTAWDHIHFQGFLGVPMSMQFTWQGCDSILAAPLVLDLVRLVEYANKQGEKGALAMLACFFKSPMGTDEHDFFRQFETLRQWVQPASQSSN